jgi:hypothetical protein
MMHYWNYLRGSLQSLRVAASTFFFRNGPRHRPGATRAPGTHGRRDRPKPPYFLDSHPTAFSREGQPQDSASNWAGQSSLGFDDDEWRMLL